MYKKSIEDFKKRFPEAYELSCAVSIAPEVESELLRKMRFEVFSTFEAGVEADVWFSPLVETRTPLAIVFSSDALKFLRDDLAKKQELLKKTWDVIAKIHRNITPALRLEEELVYLALLNDDNKELIEDKLNSILAAIVDEDRRGLAQWAFRALPQLPQKVQETESARILAVIAGTLLGQTIQLGPLPRAITWKNLSRAIPQNIAKIPVDIRLTDTSVEIGDESLLQSNRIEIPKTNPLLLEVSWGSGQNMQTYLATWEIGQTYSIKGWSGSVQVQTVLGEKYAISSLIDKWNEIEKALLNIQNNAAFSRIKLITEKVLEGYKLGLWQISTYEAFISLLYDLMEDVNNGQSLQEILSLVIKDGFRPRPHWKTPEAYFSQSNIFNQVLKESLEYMNKMNSPNLLSKFTLTLIDTTGIQDYIFTSNRLQENIGASEIVCRATTLWAFQSLEDVVGLAHNIVNRESLTWGFNQLKWVEKDPDLQAEVIQAAGGNTVILFQDGKQARKFVQKLTLRVLQDAPGLTILAQHLDNFDFGATRLPDALKTLHDNMQRHKLARRGSSPLRGLGVTAICDSTGLPAVTTLAGKITVNGKLESIGLDGEDDNSLISAEAAAKRGWRKSANDRLKHILKNAADEYAFPFDLEKLGRIKGEESYVAVIHADGNRMGDRVRAIGDKVKDAKDNRPFIQELRDFSDKINRISSSALESVVGLVVQAVKNEDIPFVEEDGKKHLPFRPLVFGGDDVTFVCNGLIGVSLAAAYIEAFEKAAEKEGISNFHASAGISIVKMHYPFARAYKLAEELTASAKTLNRDPKPDCSAVDWHFAQSGLNGSLEMIRHKEYTLEDKKSKLNLRPLFMSGNAKSWQTIRDTISTFNAEWADQHNKVVRLREVLRKGDGEAVHKYLQDFDLFKLPEIPGMDGDIRETGWKDGVCYYFDAIELLDHYVSLEAES